ncbi:MAG: PaaI family thioesterase [Pseudomonadota bacterium]
MEDLYDANQKFGCIPMEMAKTMSGADVYQKMLDGEVLPPPMYRVANIKLKEFGDGRAVIQGRPLFDHYNPIGTVHGGWIGTIMDAALAASIHTKLPVGTGFTTVEFKVNMVAPLTDKTGDVFCEGNVIHFGRRIATSEARLVNADKKLLAHGVETCTILSV